MMAHIKKALEGGAKNIARLACLGTGREHGVSGKRQGACRVWEQAGSMACLGTGREHKELRQRLGTDPGGPGAKPLRGVPAMAA